VAVPSDVPVLLELGRALIGDGLAPDAVVRRVLAWRPDSFWAFLRDGQVVGGFSMLMLNRAGLDALLADTLNTRDPPRRSLAGSIEDPTAIYLWGSGHISATDAMLKMLVRLHSPPYDMANLYAVPHTLSGLRFHQRWGFHPVAGHPRHLSEYVRLTNRSH
jgi:hypothetical protein